MGRDENPTFEVLQRINCGTVNETTSLNAWLLSPLASQSLIGSVWHGVFLCV